MLFAVKLIQNEIDWSILDVEPEEWDRRMADLGVTAPTNGLPVYAAAQAATNDQDADPGVDDPGQIGMGRHVRRICMAVLVLAMLAVYSLWRTAQTRIVRMQRDGANTVKLEAIKTKVK